MDTDISRDAAIRVLDKTLFTSVARMLSLMDRCPWSRTYGCLDRPYWHYRTLTDFPGAAWQQPLAGLALLYTTEFHGNHCYRNEHLRTWIDAGLGWWTRIQNRDGSFNEWYLRERSFCATAFTAWSAARAFRTMQGELSPGTEATVRDSLVRSGRWLLRNDNPLAGNQRAAALAALAAIAAVTDDKSFREGFVAARDRLLASQSAEGWFPEHGGADPGYSSVALDFLADAARTTGDDAVAAAASRLLEWLLLLVHPDGSIGGAHSSRGGRMFLPGGLFTLPETLRSRAAKLLWLAALTSGDGVDPLAADDRYLAYFHFNSLAAARIEGDIPGDEIPDMPSPGSPVVISLPGAGILIHRNADRFLLVGVASGGAILLYRGSRVHHVDIGYLLDDGAGNVFVTHGFDPAPRSEIFECGPNAVHLTVTARFRRWPTPAPPGGLLLGFGIATRTIFRCAPLSMWFGRLLKKRVFLSPVAGPVELTREIVLDHETLVVTDVIRSTGARLSLRLGVAPSDFAGHSPAGRMFTTGEMHPESGREIFIKLGERFATGGGAGLRTTVLLSSAGASPQRELYIPERG